MKLFSFVIFTLIYSGCFAQITGKAVKVTDGDTFHLLTDNKEQIKVRMYGIDAPEKTQDFGQKSKERLSELIFGKTMIIDVKGKDRYGRALGVVYVHGIDINRQMIINGMAWHYKKYDASTEYSEAESKARSERSGIWSMPNPVPPWEFRKKK